MNDKQTEEFYKMQNDITNIKDDVAEIKETLKSFIGASEKKMEQIKCDAEERFAGKWVEKILWSGGAVIGVAILGALLNQILK